MDGKLLKIYTSTELTIHNIFQKFGHWAMKRLIFTDIFIHSDEDKHNGQVVVDESIAFKSLHISVWS